MNNTIQYKGYVGSVAFSEEDSIFHGKVMGIRSLISYEGENVKELLDDFHGAVDDYLETCKAERMIPNTETRAALAEYDEMKKNSSSYKRYDSFNALMDSEV